MTSDLWGQIAIGTTALVGSILGYGLAGLNDARRDRRTAEREETTRGEERLLAARGAQHEFQLTTLLDLQDALQLMARLTGQAMHFDHIQARQGQLNQLPASYSDDMHANGVDVIRLRNRVLDDDLRERIIRFESASNEASLPPLRYRGLNEDQVEQVALELINQFGVEVTSVMNALGNALRQEISYVPDPREDA